MHRHLIMSFVISALQAAPPIYASIFSIIIKSCGFRHVINWRSRSQARLYKMHSAHTAAKLVAPMKIKPWLLPNFLVASSLTKTSAMRWLSGLFQTTRYSIIYNNLSIAHVIYLSLSMSLRIQSSEVFFSCYGVSFRTRIFRTAQKFVIMLGSYGRNS